MFEGGTWVSVESLAIQDIFINLWSQRVFICYFWKIVMREMTFGGLGVASKNTKNDVTY